MKKNILLTALLIMALSGNIKLFCQDELAAEIKETIHNVDSAFIKNDVTLYLESNSFFERILSIDPENSLAKYYRAYLGYRLYQQKQADTKMDYEKFYDPSVEICKDLINKKQLEGETKALLAGLYLMRIANNQMEAMTLFPQINALLKEAELIDPMNPRAKVVSGMISVNVPVAFGGSPEKAVVTLTQAIDLFAKEKNTNSITWGFAEAHAWLGQAYVKCGDQEKAKEVYERILTIEPEFAWVKYVLLPAVQKEIKN